MEDEAREQEKTQDRIAEMDDISGHEQAHRGENERCGAGRKAEGEETAKDEACSLPGSGASPKRDAPQEPGEPNADRERERRQQKTRKKCRDPAQGAAERNRRSFQMRRD